MLLKYVSWFSFSISKPSWHQKDICYIYHVDSKPFDIQEINSMYCVVKMIEFNLGVIQDPIFCVHNLQLVKFCKRHLFFDLGGYGILSCVFFLFCFSQKTSWYCYDIYIYRLHIYIACCSEEKTYNTVYCKI